MPLYEYECPSCGRFERVQKFSDPLLKKCPTCGKPVEKLLSPPAIQFKGTGWYVTDYAGKGSGKGSDKDGAGEGKAKDSKGGKEGSSGKESSSGKDSSSTSSSSKPAKGSS